MPDQNAATTRRLISDPIGRYKYVIFLGYFVFASLCYFLLWNKSFSSDDFLVLKRVCIDESILVPGFFRPLSDLSLLLSFKVGGFSQPYFILPSILLHTVCAFLLFTLVQRVHWIHIDERPTAGLIASFLFLIYPFHNESIVWAVGRGSILATLFGLASIHFSISIKRKFIGYILAGLCYYIALLGYESVVFLPLITLAFIWYGRRGKAEYIRMTAAYLLALVLHLISRSYFSGSITGEYGSSAITKPVYSYLANLAKSLARLMVPPIWQSSIFVVVTGCVLAMLVFITWKVHRSASNEERKAILRILLSLLFALAVPISFSISTRTSESDRFLYFPSVFFCLLVAIIVINCSRRIYVRSLITVLISIYFLINLQLNNKNWKTSSEQTRKIINKMREVSALNRSHTLIINLPQEYRGAFVFQNGFADALLINGIDTSGIVVVNQLTIEQMANLGASITPVYRNDSITIEPVVKLVRNERLYIDDKEIPVPKDALIMFWNKQELLELKKK